MKNNNKIIEIFRESLPRKPYYSNDLTFGLRINAVDKVQGAKYIQYNGPTHLKTLCFDVDKAGALLNWRDANAPAPNLIIENPVNRHAHLLYILETPVRKNTPDARQKPLKYAAAIEQGLIQKLDSDRGFTGLICKNPLNSYWNTHTFETQLYDLDYLSEFVDLNNSANEPKIEDAAGLGRNCSLFESLRIWSYKAIRQGWPQYEQWLNACNDRASMLNAQFPTPLCCNEAAHVAKSVAKWTYSHFSESDFRAIQSARGKKGGRPKNTSSERQVKPWETLGISRATYYRNKKSETKSHIR